MQVGDRVRCIQSNPGIIEGQYYTVLSIRDRFCCVDTEGEFEGREYFDFRFVVENEPAQLQPAKHTVTRYAVVFHNTIYNKINLALHANAIAAESAERALICNGYTVLKKTIVSLEVDLPEGVVL